MNRDELIDFYRLRQESFETLEARDKRVISWLSLLRLIVFFGGILVAVYLFRVSNLAGMASILLSMIVFGVLLKIYSSRSWIKQYHSNMAKVNSQEVQSISEEYSGFNDGSGYTDSTHDFSHDIDMFGKGSVFQSVNRCCTERGESLLADWLLNPAGQAEDFQARRDAIMELSEKTDWRQKFSSLGMMNLTSAKETASFNEWMSEEPKFINSKVLRSALILLPLLTIVLFLLWAVSLISISWFVLIFLLNLMILGFNLARLNRIHDKVSKKSSYLSVVSLMIEHIEKEDFESHLLREQKAVLGAESTSALLRVKRLARIIQMFDSRLNMIMGVVLNGLLLWDFQCVVRIEKWKADLAGLVPQWFDCVAYFDAINSLGVYANNNPDFVYPELSDNRVFLDATMMGHHLIPASKRISNDYRVPQPGAINIITGANMAGKSTFLRTVAVNMILAMNGAPVCAARFVFTPVDIFTSMRTSDSLSDEESYFFAELKRLRKLVDLLEEDTKPFFILDEILKGTNSKDKSEGSKAFIEKVISLGGTGMVATHDISIGKMQETYPKNVSNNCFEIEIEKGSVRFDYILRDGITTKMNAALLMKQQGIV